MSASAMASAWRRPEKRTTGFLRLAPQSLLKQLLFLEFELMVFGLIIFRENALAIGVKNEDRGDAVERGVHGVKNKNMVAGIYFYPKRVLPLRLSLRGGTYCNRFLTQGNGTSFV